MMLLERGLHGNEDVLASTPDARTRQMRITPMRVFQWVRCLFCLFRWVPIIFRLVVEFITLTINLMWPTLKEYDNVFVQILFWPQTDEIGVNENHMSSQTFTLVTEFDVPIGHYVQIWYSHGVIFRMPPYSY